jgi:hypothetical protein
MIGRKALTMNPQRFLWGALLAVPVGILLVLLADYLIITDEELVTATLHRLARDLEANDAEAVLEHISAASPQLRAEAKTQLGRFVFHSAVVKRNLDVTVSSDRTPPVAEARFNGVADVSDRVGLVTKARVARYFIVNLRKEDGRWRISRYEDLDPMKRR